MLDFVDRDEYFMARALGLARETTGLASPNPQVGCVLTRPDHTTSPASILGEGAHLYEQRDHAEIVALKQAKALGHEVRGATAYVTLEPCAHHGRTGPCADALIAAGITRCIVATEDPNPLVSGEGIRRMQVAGVEVSVGTGQQEARALNDAFAYSIQHRRPFVTLKAALSVDGFIAPPPKTRAENQPHWLTGPASREEVHRMRHASDAILTGVGTVLADDPALTDRSGLPRRRPLLRVILDPQLRTPVTSQLLSERAQTPSGTGGDLLFVCADTAPLSREEALTEASERRLETLRLPAGPGGRLNLPAVLAHLRQRRDCLSVLLETGSALNSAFLHADLVDRVVLFFSERELGAGSVPFAAAGPSPYLLQQRLLRLSNTPFGRDIMIKGLLHDPWPAGLDQQPQSLGII